MNRNRKDVGEAIAAHLIKGMGNAAIAHALMSSVAEVQQEKSEVVTSADAPPPSKEDKPFDPFDMVAEMFRRTAEVNEYLAIADDVDNFVTLNKAGNSAAVKAKLDTLKSLANVPFKKAKSIHLIAALAAETIKSPANLSNIANDQTESTNADDDNDPHSISRPISDENKLLILVDADSSKLVQRIFSDYVSDSNLEKFAQFLLSFDKLLYKFRDGKPLEKEEIEELEEIEEARDQKRKHLRKSKKSKTAKKVKKPNDDSVDEDVARENDDSDDLEETEVTSSVLGIEAADKAEMDSVRKFLVNYLDGYAPISQLLRHSLSGHYNYFHMMMTFYRLLFSKDHTLLFNFRATNVNRSRIDFVNANGAVLQLCVPRAAIGNWELIIPRNGDMSASKVIVTITSPNGRKELWGAFKKFSEFTPEGLIEYGRGLPVDMNYKEEGV